MPRLTVLVLAGLMFGLVPVERAFANELAEGRSAFVEAKAAFLQARYAEALRLFERSYLLTGQRELIYNIGRCHEELRHPEEAIAAFERFLATKPPPDEVIEVERKLDSLRAGRAAGEGSRPRRPRWLWGLVGGGAVLVVAGVVLGAVLGSRPEDPTPTVGRLTLTLP